MHNNVTKKCYLIKLFRGALLSDFAPSLYIKQYVRKIGLSKFVYGNVCKYGEKVISIRLKRFLIDAHIGFQKLS
jgi:hypothetical protein